MNDGDREASWALAEVERQQQHARAEHRPRWWLIVLIAVLVAGIFVSFDLPDRTVGVALFAGCLLAAIVLATALSSPRAAGALGLRSRVHRSALRRRELAVGAVLAFVQPMAYEVGSALADGWQRPYLVGGACVVVTVVVAYAVFRRLVGPAPEQP